MTSEETRSRAAAHGAGSVAGRGLPAGSREPQERTEALRQRVSGSSPAAIAANRARCQLRQASHRAHRVVEGMIGSGSPGRGQVSHSAAHQTRYGSLNQGCPYATLKP